MPYNDLWCPQPVAPVVPSRGRWQAAELSAVDLTGWWGRWQQVNASGVLPHCHEWMERLGWIGNLEAAAAGTLPQARRGREFTDADVYKLLEALGWELGRRPDGILAGYAERLWDVVVAAIEPDGYVSSAFGHPGQPGRYTDLEWGHELYCYGHLLQAVVAWTRVFGPGRWLEAGHLVAEHVVREFGPAGRVAVCGHPGIEVALVEFARLTGDARYLEQARLFIDRRGHQLLADIEFGRGYFQDDVPVRESEVLSGHAVRALYLAAACVDLAVETGDAVLLATVERQWENTVARRTYLTGGMGSRHQDEAFGEDFELPPDRAYCETCAGVGSIMLSWRLLLATGRSRYADLIERTLYNVVLTSPRSDGRAFFYANTLHQRVAAVDQSTDGYSPRAAAAERSAWFEVSCCPANVARQLATVAALTATTSVTGAQLHQYAAGDYRLSRPDGAPIHLRVATDYPEAGRVEIRVMDAPADWRLELRVPDWGEGTRLSAPGFDGVVPPGRYVTVPGTLRVGDVAVLRLPVEPRFTTPDPRIDAIRGCVAVERGPLVYCVESVDLVGVALDEVRLDTRVPLSATDGAVTASAQVARCVTESWPYASAPALAAVEPATVRLHPYLRWGERGPSAMRVWVPTAQITDQTDVRSTQEVSR